MFTISSVNTWYRYLAKPPWTPPSWVFGPVWTTLYILMGFALYLVWKSAPLGRNETRALTWFFIQLGLNVLWSFFFFYLRDEGLAYYEIMLLWLAIAISIGTFARVSLTAAALMLPYLMWVSFAAYLNAVIFNINS